MNKKYSMDMTQEKSPMKLIPEGWANFEIVKVEEQVSKAGNQMFKISFVLADDPTSGIDIYAIAEPGKRWFLKSLLEVCDCPASADGIYDWSPEDIEGKTIQANVTHQIETWIDRDGNERKTPKAKIVEFRKLEVK